MFSCRDTAELMTEADEGALTGFRRFMYTFHVKLCPHCRACRRQFERTVELAHEIPREEIPHNVERRALDAFRTRLK
jgi:hypothetical protein